MCRLISGRFSDGTRALLRALPRWTVRLLVPKHLADAVGLYRSRLARGTGDARCGSPPPRNCAGTSSGGAISPREPAAQGRDEAKYVRARDAFGAPRYRVLYRSWLQHGPSVLNETVSPVLADAIARGTGGLETRESVPSLSPSRPLGCDGMKRGAGGQKGGHKAEGELSPSRQRRRCEMADAIRQG